MFDIHMFGQVAFAKLWLCHDWLENWWLGELHPGW